MQFNLTTIDELRRRVSEARSLVRDLAPALRDAADRAVEDGSPPGSDLQRRLQEADSVVATLHEQVVSFAAHKGIQVDLSACSADALDLILEGLSADGSNRLHELIDGAGKLQGPSLAIRPVQAALERTRRICEAAEIPDSGELAALENALGAVLVAVSGVHSDEVLERVKTAFGYPTLVGILLGDISIVTGDFGQPPESIAEPETNAEPAPGARTPLKPEPASNRHEPAPHVSAARWQPVAELAASPRQITSEEPLPNSPPSVEPVPELPEDPFAASAVGDDGPGAEPAADSIEHMRGSAPIAEPAEVSAFWRLVHVFSAQAEAMRGTVRLQPMVRNPAIGEASRPARRDEATPETVSWPWRTETADSCSRPTVLLTVADLAPPLPAAADLAKRCLAANGPPDGRQLALLIWALATEGRHGLGYCVASSLEVSSTPQGMCLPSWLLGVLAAAQQLSRPRGDLAKRLVEMHWTPETSEFVAQLENNDDGGMAMALALGAALIPAGVVAADRGAANLLRSCDALLARELPDFHAVAEIALAVADHGVPLDLLLLRDLQGPDSRDARLGRLRTQVGEWLDTPRVFRFAPSSEVWRRWIERGPEGVLHRLLDPIRVGDRSRKSDVEALIEEVSNRRLIYDRIHRVDRAVNRRGGGRDIQGGEPNRLFERLQPAVGLAQQWIDLLDSEERVAAAGDVAHHTDVARTLAARCGSLRNTLEGHTDVPDNAAWKIGATILCQSLQRIEELVDPALSLPLAEPALVHVLMRDALCSGAQLDAWWRPTEGATALLPKLLRGAISTPDAAAAFDVRLEHGDHVGSRLLIELATAEGPPGVETLELRRAEGLARERTAIRKALASFRLDIERAFGRGAVPESTRAALIAQVERTEERSEHVEDFVREREGLAAQRDELRRQIDDKRAQILQELAAFGSRVSADDRRRVEESVANEDIVTANDYIGQLQADGELSAESAPGGGPWEFVDALDDLDQRLGLLDAASPEDPRWQSFLRNIEQRQPLGGLRLTELDGKRIQGAQDALRAWRHTKLRRDRTVSEDMARDILQKLGWARITSLRVIPGRPLTIQFQSGQEPDPERCPVPAFGSAAARGGYSVHCYWDRPHAARVLADFGVPHPDDPARIVFWFGRMNRQKRSEMATECVRKRLPVLVVDDIALAYVCLSPGDPHRSLFTATLPFTFVEPYSARAGTCPPEMFYGRFAERKAIERGEVSFVYGGRQLGKTVLLHNVAHSFHKPADQKVALYLDIKQLTEGFWIHLGERIKELASRTHIPLVPNHFQPRKGGPGVLIGHLRSWLLEDSSRVLLLLLDEADNFLAYDAIRRPGQPDGYAMMGILRELSVSTKDRFRVVLAGLHNVLRTSLRGNHPLGQLSPRRIGPMMQGEELKAARELVDVPFRAMGFQFESPDLVTRILSQTNYYPSLIQLYCELLLKHLIAERETPETPVPTVIRSDDLERAYREKDLREAIRYRFGLTLDLDLRYKVIAYAMGFAILMDEVPASDKVGFSVQWTLRYGQVYWPMGFEDMTESSVRLYLEEMVQLGVLRAVGTNFTLRNQNVLLLLGPEGEILEVLSRMRDAEEPLGAAAAREKFEGPDGHALFSPLLQRQEYDLRDNSKGGKRVHVLIGSLALGLDQIEVALASSFSRQAVRRIEGPLLPALDTAFDSLRSERRTGTTLLLVGDDVAWDESWLRSAQGRATALYSQDAVHVIFLAGPGKAWHYRAEFARPPPSWPDIRIERIERWSDDDVRHWLEETGALPASLEARTAIRHCTGYWTVLLAALHRLSASAPQRWQQALGALDTAMATPELASAFLSAVGLEGRRLEVVRALSALSYDAGAAGGCVAVPASDVMTVLEPQSGETIEEVLDWAEQLHIASRGIEGGEECWTPEHTVARALSVSVCL